MSRHMLFGRECWYATTVARRTNTRLSQRRLHLNAASRRGRVAKLSPLSRLVSRYVFVTESARVSGHQPNHGFGEYHQDPKHQVGMDLLVTSDSHRRAAVVVLEF